MAEVSILTPSDMNEWNSLVEKSISASVYHRWEWGDVLSSTYGYQTYQFAVRKNDEICGVLPLIHVRSRLFGNRLISLPFCEYGGPLIDPELGIERVQEVIENLLSAATNLAKDVGVEYVEIRSPRPSFSQETLRVWGYSSFQRYLTFETDLTKPLETLWNNLNKKTRNAVRKAMKSGVLIKEVESDEQLGEYYGLYLQTQKRHGSPPHKLQLFEKILTAFRSQGKVKMLLAEYHDEPIGGIIIFHNRKTIFWWNNVTDIRHRSLNPTNLLLWNTIEWGVKQGFQKLDLGRTRKGTTIYNFKRGWGGQETYLQDFVYFLSSKNRKLPEPEQRGFRYLSQIWSLMPTILAKKIGPKIICGIAL